MIDEMLTKLGWTLPVGIVAACYLLAHVLANILPGDDDGLDEW